MALSSRSLITKTGISTTQVFDMGGINISGGDFNLGSNIKLGNASGIITCTTFSGSGASLTNLPAGNLTGTVADARISALTASKLSGALPAISGANLTNLPAQATIANNADNRVITGGSGVNLNGEANLTYDGTTLQVQSSGSGLRNLLRLKNSNASAGTSGLYFNSTASGSAFDAACVRNGVNGSGQGRLFLQTNNGSGLVSGLEIEYDGQVTLPTNSLNILDSIVHIGDTNTKIRFPAADTFSVETAGSERLRIESGGAVLMMGASQSNAFSGGDDLVIGNTSSGTRTGMTLVSATNQDSGIYFSDGNSGSDVVRGQVVYHHDGNYMRLYTDGNERLRIGSAGGHKITCDESHFSANLSEMNTGNLALNIIKTRQGQTKGIGFGAIGSSQTNTGIQAYDTSNNSANPLLLNPFGGKINIGCPDNGTANAGLNVEDSTNNSTNTLKLINKPSGANGKARLEFYTETSSGQGCSPYIMSTSGTDAFGSNSANDGGLQFHSKHGGSGTDVNALEISNKGYVLQPQRPYFKANLSSGTRITSTGYVTFNSAVHNNGSHYSTSNGKFTAPIAGLYWFSARINAYDRIDFTIRVNGSDVERGQYNTDSDNVGWWSNQLTTIVEMTAGQYAQVHVNNLDQQADPGTWCTFMGYLLN